MFFNLLIGAVAGYVARYAEAPLGGLLKDKYAMDKPDLRVLTFILLLLAASILIGIAGADGKPFVLLIGGAVGIFFNYLRTHGTEQFKAQKAKIEERKASSANSEAVETSAEATVEPVTEPAETAAPAKKTETKKPADKKPAADA
jgi:hypothetical protein